MDEQAIKAREIYISCGQCFKETKKTLSWLSENRNINVVCVHCGHANQIDKSLVRQAIEQLKELPIADLIEPPRK